MNIQRPFLGLVLTFLFLMGAFATPRVSTAYADTLSNTEPVQIAQSDEEKPKEGEDEDDLGEDDC